MTINRGSVISKEYFIAYLKHVMVVFHYSLAEASAKLEQTIFHGDLHAYGEETNKNFTTAYQELDSKLSSCCINK